MEPLPIEDAPPLRPRRRLWPKLVFAFVCLALACGTFLGMRYRAGAVPDFSYAEFQNDSCKLLMIGTPGVGSGDRSTSTHWSTPIRTELHCNGIAPGTESTVRPEDLFSAEIERRAKELYAKVEKEAAVKWNDYPGREAVFVNGRIRTVERYLFVARPGQPRLYVISVGGPGLEANSEVVPKVFGSFRLK